MTPNQPGKISSVYFIGIGGIGMSALARYFNLQGASVSGYDKTPTALTTRLIEEGIPVHFTEDLQLTPSHPDLVVYTPAVPSDHAEMKYYRETGVPMKKRAEVLGEITASGKTIAVAGTHGKTTVSTLIAHILQTANQPFMGFLGGISKNHGGNFLFFPPNLSLKENPSGQALNVVEADEYDRSFLHLTPFVAIITAADPDHLDIYGHPEDLKRSFETFASRIQKGGHLILKQGVAIHPAVQNNYAVHSYSVDRPADFQAVNIRLEKDLYLFDLVTPDRVIRELKPGIPGLFNLENAVAAMAAGYLLGIPDETLRASLASYQGVQRRFDFRIRREGLVYIDDYAHHPVELTACINAVSNLYPGKKITGIFQPHLFSRTRDFADDFARSLELLDELWLLEIYPAREKPIPGVNAAMLLERIRMDKKMILSKQEVLSRLSEQKPEVLLTLGAGDIDKLVNPIETLLRNPEMR